MLFNSFHFIFFLPVAVAVYYATPHRWRWAWLLAASYYFYMSWKPEYALLILCSTAVDYFAALRMHGEKDPKRRRRWLAASLGTNLGLLGTFKYWNFFGESVESALGTLNILADVPALQVLLPVGISFYTFQTLSYTLDVYRGKIEPERHFGYFAVYVAFWPQLVAGPIERPAHLLPQLRQTHFLRPRNIRAGLSIMLWGFFQKLVIADRLAIYVDSVYSRPAAELGGGEAWIGTYAFAFQIYCDFSGYSLIAIGAARLMGIELMTNFRRPYVARSIGEFWRRWHISLSTWFRDYVYIPLGGSRQGRAKHLRNLMLTFAVSGLWHGAGWTFVIWGTLHGLFLVIQTLAGSRRREAPAPSPPKANPLLDAIKILITFHLVVITWVFFRAEDLDQALGLLGRMLTDPWSGFAPGFMTSLAGPVDPWVAVVAVLFLLVLETVQGDRDIKEWLDGLGPVPRGAWYLSVSLLLLWFGVFNSQEFLYFQF